MDRRSRHSGVQWAIGGSDSREFWGSNEGAWGMGYRFEWRQDGLVLTDNCSVDLSFSPYLILHLDPIKSVGLRS